MEIFNSVLTHQFVLAYNVQRILSEPFLRMQIAGNSYEAARKHKKLGNEVTSIAGTKTTCSKFYMGNALYAFYWEVDRCHFMAP